MPVAKPSGILSSPSPRLVTFTSKKPHRRKKTKTTVSRVMDLDILLFDQEVVNTRNLKVPHPEIPNRRFVLLPLSELVPALRHPVLAQTVSVLLVTTADTGKVGLYKPQQEERRLP